MAKKKSKLVKTKRAADTAAPTKGTKAPTKVQQVVELCQRKSGCTTADIVEALGVSKVAASSLLGDIRHKGMDLKRDAQTGAYHLS